jgi:outer membrane lipopolysaccharide assembly protein LptE/RlpB
MLRRLCLILFLGFISFSFGCGYTLKGKGSFLPENIKIIAIQEFPNQTQKFDIEKTIVQKLQDELSSRGDFTVTNNPAEADAYLSGVITLYKTSPKSVDADGRATSYSIRITLDIKFTDLKANRVLFEDKNYTITEEYQLTNLDQEFLDQEEFAIDEAAQRLAESLISAILEGF